VNLKARMAKLRKTITKGWCSSEVSGSE
jgi:hypothetical protein